MDTTSANITLSGYKNFKSLIDDIIESSKNVPTNFSTIVADIYITYKDTVDEEQFPVKITTSIETSTIEEAINELKKLSTEDYTKITLDVSLEKNYNAPKEYHTCIYSSKDIGYDYKSTNCYSK